MRILLDECIPRKFKNSLVGHECQTVPQAGLAGMKNGQLLDNEEKRGFQVFLTVDQGIEFEQNLEGRGIAILILRAKSNGLSDLTLHAESCLAALRSINPGQLKSIGH